jgi:hypothetical protein
LHFTLSYCYTCYSYLYNVQTDDAASISRMKAVLHCNRATCLLQLAAQQQQQREQSSKLHGAVDSCATAASCSDAAVAAVAAPCQTVPKLGNGATSTTTLATNDDAVIDDSDTPAAALRLVILHVLACIQSQNVTAIVVLHAACSQVCSQ